MSQATLPVASGGTLIKTKLIQDTGAMCLRLDKNINDLYI